MFIRNKYAIHKSNNSLYPYPIPLAFLSVHIFLSPPACKIQNGVRYPLTKLHATAGSIPGSAGCSPSLKPQPAAATAWGISPCSWHLINCDPCNFLFLWWGMIILGFVTSPCFIKTIIRNIFFSCPAYLECKFGAWGRELSWFCASGSYQGGARTAE